MTTKHTPGPWRYSPDFYPLGCIETSTRKRICDIQFPHNSATMSSDKFEIQARQNAILIAAAPDMLNALLIARTFIEESMRMVTNNTERMANIRALKVVEDAIRKAKGDM